MNTYGHLLQETDQRASSHFDKLFDEKSDSGTFWGTD